MRWKIPNPFAGWVKKDAAAAQEAAAKIVERHARKREVQGLLTPSQEELRKELGLTPDGYEQNQNGKPVRKEKDPLTKRQRALLKELGLDKHDED
jgi:hypothetical protein